MHEAYKLTLARNISASAFAPAKGLFQACAFHKSLIFAKGPKFLGVYKDLLYKEGICVGPSSAIPAILFLMT
jgi:hypothetical protein